MAKCGGMRWSSCFQLPRYKSIESFIKGKGTYSNWKEQGLEGHMGLVVEGVWDDKHALVSSLDLKDAHFFFILVVFEYNFDCFFDDELILKRSHHNVKRFFFEDGEIWDYPDYVL